jgi:hypothetical protein
LQRPGVDCGIVLLKELRQPQRGGEACRPRADNQDANIKTLAFH